MAMGRGSWAKVLVLPLNLGPGVEGAAGYLVAGAQACLLVCRRRSGQQVLLLPGVQMVLTFKRRDASLRLCGGSWGRLLGGSDN